MAKRLFLLLIATLALGGGVYAVRNKKPEKRLVAAITANTPSLQIGEASAGRAPHQEPVAFSPATLLKSRIALLIIVAAVSCAGAYLGLGQGSESALAAASVHGNEDSADATSDSPVTRSASTLRSAPVVEDDFRTLVSRGVASLTPPPAPASAQPAPTPVVAAEVETPAPVAPQPAAPAVQMPTDGLEAIICALPWPCEQAISVAACESGRDMSGRLDGAWATNGNHYGVFQISGIHAYKWSDFYDTWMDPAKNAQWAYEIYAQQGWYPWSCRWAAY